MVNETKISWRSYYGKLRSQFYLGELMLAAKVAKIALNKSAGAKPAP